VKDQHFSRFVAFDRAPPDRIDRNWADFKKRDAKPRKSSRSHELRIDARAHADTRRDFDTPDALPQTIVGSHVTHEVNEDRTQRYPR
jgi:hypothetical protein